MNERNFFNWKDGLICTSQLCNMALSAIQCLLAIFGQFSALNAFDLSNYDCFVNVCLPKDYNKLQRPSSSLTVYTNIQEDKDGFLKDIDVNGMMLTFAPNLWMTWHDPRLKFINISQNLSVLALDEFIFEKIWSPRLTIQPHNRDWVSNNQAIGVSGKFCDTTTMRKHKDIHKNF